LKVGLVRVFTVMSGTGKVDLQGWLGRSLKIPGRGGEMNLQGGVG